MKEIAHVITYLGRNFGGPVIAMEAMVAGLISAGEAVSVFSVQRQGDGPPINLTPSVNVHLSKDLSWGALRHSPDLWAALDRAKAAIVHSHGLWTDVHRCASAIAHRHGVPHVLSPCGMLDPDALRRSTLKKYLMRIWFQSKALRLASCLIANSEKEFADIRQFGLTNPVAVIPNPVKGRETPKESGAGEFLASYPTFSGKKILLYLGRIHPVKGLERLIDAWGGIPSFHQDWNLVLAGPDEGGYRAIIEARVARRNCQNSVHFVGALDEERKWRALQAADLFVMPSDFENFGLSIAEAMLAGKPVITTTGTPWSVLPERHAGWWVDRTPAALQDAIHAAMVLSAQERRAMGEQGRLIAEQFTPGNVAQELIALYQWLGNAGDRPACVRID